MVEKLHAHVETKEMVGLIDPFFRDFLWMIFGYFLVLKWMDFVQSKAQFLGFLG